jgi:ADP-ribosyl-[dinitrogen reductase] hydrolase
MWGAVIGDIVGSIYEWDNVKTKDFGSLFLPGSFFTDDTVCTVAVADMDSDMRTVLAALYKSAV